MKYIFFILKPNISNSVLLWKLFKKQPSPKCFWSIFFRGFIFGQNFKGTGVKLLPKDLEHF